MFHMPMSSPMMTTMLGFSWSCAAAAAIAAIAATAEASRSNQAKSYPAHMVPPSRCSKRAGSLCPVANAAGSNSYFTAPQASAASVVARLPVSSSTRRARSCPASCRGGNSLKVGSCCANEGLRRDQHEGAVDPPAAVADALVVAALERVGAQGEQLGQAQLDERLLPDVEAVRPLLEEVDLPLVVAQRREVCRRRSSRGTPCAGLRPFRRRMQLVVAVEVHLVGLVADLRSPPAASP